MAGYRRNPRRDAELLALIDEGVNAAAAHMQDAVREKFEERDLGYTSGEYARGAAANIQRTAPYTKRGMRRADIFTEAFRDGRNGREFYPAHWEFGHRNLFIDPTGQTFVRVPTFQPAMEEQAGAIEGIMARQIRQWNQVRSMRSGGITVGVNLRDFGL